MKPKDAVPELKLKFRSEKQIALRHMIYQGLANALVFLFVVEVLIIGCATIIPWCDWLKPFAYANFVGMPVFPAWLFAIVLTAIHAGNSATRYSWLASYYCKSLLAVFAEYPELEEYRAKVIAAGRQFTKYEYDALLKYDEDCRHHVAVKEWREWEVAAQAKCDKVCRELYGIPSADDKPAP